MFRQIFHKSIEIITKEKIRIYCLAIFLFLKKLFHALMIDWFIYWF